MAATNVEHSQRSEQQKSRRLAKRNCGRCSRPASRMLAWSGQQIPICDDCQEKLDEPKATSPWCAFNEVHPLELRPQATPAGILIEARLLPSLETPTPRRSLAGRFLGALGRALRPRSRRRKGRGAIAGKSS